MIFILGCSSKAVAPGICKDEKSQKYCKKQLKKGNCLKEKIIKVCMKTCDGCGTPTPPIEYGCDVEPESRINCTLTEQQICPDYCCQNLDKTQCYQRKGFGYLLDIINTLQMAIADNAVEIANLNPIITNTFAGIADNAAKIANNTQKIGNNAGVIVNNVADIAYHDTEIANLNPIITNTVAGIADNAAKIANNTQKIGNNAGVIANNAADIAYHGIAIEYNTEIIVNNVDGIANNTADIANHDTDMKTNAANIESNNVNIENLQSNVSVLDLQINQLGYVKCPGKPGNVLLPSSGSFFPTVRVVLENCYWFSNISANYYEAQEMCQEFNGRLFEPKTKFQNDAVYKAYAEVTVSTGLTHAFIGINDLDVEGSWVYSSSDQEVAFDNFGDGSSAKPSQGKPLDCAYMHSTKGFWNDIHCEYNTRFICEFF